MSKYFEAAQALQREAKRAEAMIQAAEMLADMGAIDQAINEHKQAAAQAKQAAEEAKQELTGIKAAIDSAAQANIVRQKEIDAAVKFALQNANEQAAAIKAGAEALAKRISQDAISRAQADVAAITSQIDTLKTVKTKLEGEIAEMRERAHVATADAMAAETRLAKVKESIAKLASA